MFRNPENAYWILLKVSNSSGHPGLWYLKLSYPQLDEVIFWQEVENRTEELQSTLKELREANHKLKLVSLDDPLTGLRNRRHLDNILPELCAEAMRTRQPLSIAIMDADHFKRLNDTWGHSFGDRCLQHIANTLARHARRPRDVVIRFGGEEFALLLPDTEVNGASSLCNRILKAMEASPLVAPDGTEVIITLSAGVAMSVPGEQGPDLFRRADEALYCAKQQGRNRTVIASVHTPEAQEDPIGEQQPGTQ